MRLVLKCKVCGRERPYVFPKVYYDISTALNEKKRKQYDPLIIPQRVTCSKCGAVDQYELSGMGHVAIMANMVAASAPSAKGVLRPDQQIKFLTFTTRWGEMHPDEADERYRNELAQKPNDADLHVGYANQRRVGAMTWTPPVTCIVAAMSLRPLPVLITTIVSCGCTSPS